MKNIILTFLITLFAIPLYSQVNPNNHYVNGYFRSDGTYVKGHYRTNRNSTNRDNYTTKPNINPYTGKKGYIEPDNNYQLPTNYDAPTLNYNSYPLPNFNNRKSKILNKEKASSFLKNTPSNNLELQKTRKKIRITDPNKRKIFTSVKIVEESPKSNTSETAVGLIITVPIIVFIGYILFKINKRK